MSRIISDEAARELTTMAVNNGIISQENSDKMISLNQESGKSIISILFDNKYMDEFSLAKLVAESYGLNFQEIDPDNINPEAQNKLNQNFNL